VGHSLSPLLHRAAYDALGLDWTYTAIECTEVELPARLDQLRSRPGWAGASLTMPLKTPAVRLVDRLDPTAELVGAVNTVVVEPDGTLSGHNTDVIGIHYAVTRVLGDRRMPARALVLGAGGTARATLAALARIGVTRVGVVARRPGAVEPLARIGARLGLDVTALAWDAVAGGVPAGPDLVVATTPAGATDELATRRWPADCPLVELLYYPWPTALAAAAYRSGSPVAGGLAVLAAQAVGQVELFTRQSVEAALLLAVGSAELAQRCDKPHSDRPGPARPGLSDTFDCDAFHHVAATRPD
jgi:shikimate dehydrogenase